MKKTAALTLALLMISSFSYGTETHTTKTLVNRKVANEGKNCLTVAKMSAIAIEKVDDSTVSTKNLSYVYEDNNGNLSPEVYDITFTTPQSAASTSWKVTVDFINGNCAISKVEINSRR